MCAQKHGPMMNEMLGFMDQRVKETDTVRKRIGERGVTYCKEKNQWVSGPCKSKSKERE